MNQYALILQAFDLLIQHKVWEEKKPSEILRILMYVHSKGWLYVPTEDGNIQAVVAAYRIPEVNDDTLVKMPIEESGTILYVPFALSLKKDGSIFKIVRGAMQKYIEHNPFVTEIVMEDKNKKIKRFKIKGAFDGKRKESGIISAADVSRES